MDLTKLTSKQLHAERYAAWVAKDVQYALKLHREQMARARKATLAAQVSK